MPEALIIKKDDLVIMQNEAYTSIEKERFDSAEGSNLRDSFDSDFIPQFRVKKRTIPWKGGKAELQMVIDNREIIKGHQAAL